MADKSSRVPSSVDVVFDDDDLLSTILLFVPAKPLVSGIKLVCKRWQSLVSDKQFRLKHALHRRHNPPTSFIIRANPRCFFYFCPGLEIFRPFQFRFPYSKILQSCHGLLLLEIRKSLHGAKHYSVYNPTTTELSSDILIIGSISGLCLAFDPSISPFFKVVSIKHDKKHLFLYWIEIYDSQTRAWTCLKKPFVATRHANFFNGIFWNNGIYWIRRVMNAKSYYLDLETGIVGTPQRVLTHKRCNSGSRKNYVMESDGNLHYVSLYSRVNKMSLKVSVLLNDSAWFEKHEVNLSPLFTKFQEILDAQLAVLCIARGGDTEEDSAVFFLMWDKIIFYRFCDGYFKDIFDHLPTKEFYKHGRLHYQRNHAYPFIETLVPI